MATVEPVELLPLQFVGKGAVLGFRFKMIAVSIGAYAYQVNTGNRKLHFEVFKRKTNTRHPNGKKTGLIEVYPKSNSFGVWAFKYTSKDAAMNKFHELGGSKNPLKK